MVQQCSQQRPIQNSEVYVFRKAPPFPAISPPSPITPAEDFDHTSDALGLSQPDIVVCSKKLAVIEERLARAVHVLATETTALQKLTELFASDRVARDGFTRAVDATIRSQANNSGKLVIIGIGKSGHIAKKLVATFNSLAVQAAFLHPTEALHGDLGQISRHDTLLLITFSGKTPELLTLLPHLDRSLPLILLTGHTRRETCELLRHRPDAILLPAPVHETETTSFGVAAPTTSTTTALTVGDALAIVASRELHPSLSSVFARNHPGGAIGAALWKQEEEQQQQQPRDEEVRSVMVPMSDIPPLPDNTTSSSPTSRSTSATTTTTTDPPAAHKNQTTGLDVLRAGYASPSGWLQLSPPTQQQQQQNPNDNNIHHGGGGVISPSKIRRLTTEDMARALEDLRSWLVIPRGQFIPVAADASVQRAAEWIRGLRAATATGCVYGDEAIVAVMENRECVGLLEVGRLLEVA
ncbi:SIS domain-containing protein [Parathielavia hyrcaniae]|uniref:SIS domain-containing protein n=1 Tax=Parathielavia hyrcaniae TaxID=113614 RepID=A0AAN6T510_9PEZI|nr:SIS domain-containing protein [Parathielavia hyrcaniae]